MKLPLLIFLSLSCLVCFSQVKDSSAYDLSDFLKTLAPGDSVMYYQCHVEAGVQQLSTVSGQTLTGTPQRYTITEKYVVTLKDGRYVTDYYTSALTVFPNRKFSGLKMREKPYWEFKKERSFVLSAQDLRVFTALENKGREATEYDFPITKYTTNQLIISSKSNFKQLVINGSYVLSRLLN